MKTSTLIGIGLAAGLLLAANSAAAAVVDVNATANAYAAYLSNVAPAVRNKFAKFFGLLYARGYRITWASIRREDANSYHGYGYAVDLNVITPNGQQLLKAAGNAGWREVGELAKEAGLRWGGDFSTPDPNHFDAGYDISLDALKRGLGSIYYRCADGTFTDKKSAKGACTKHGGLYKGEDGIVRNTASGEAYAVWFPVAKINTDTTRFQNRDADYSAESVQKLIDNFDINKLDPITVWRDDAQGKVYVLSGHSRLHAFKEMRKEKIPVRFFVGSEADAMRYGKVEANRTGTPETLKEDIKAFILDRDGNERLGIKPLDKQQLQRKYGANMARLNAYTYLNPSGKFLSIVGTDSEKSFPYIAIKAAEAGRLRMRFPDLSNAHEDEIFEYRMLDKNGVKVASEDFVKRIGDMAVSNKLLLGRDFTELPLNLSNTGERGVAARSDTKEANLALNHINKEMERLTALRRSVTTQGEKAAINAQLLRYQGEKEKLENGIKNAVKSQAALFGINQYYYYGSR